MSEPLTVTQFNDRITSLISTSDLVREIEMVGEIYECKRSTQGHIYITLKDERSTVKCTLFRFAASKLRFEPKVGMKVTVFGSASYYSAGGSLNFNIEGMREFGKGALQEALEKLKLKLMEEGLFDPDKKRPIPKYPKTIGVVTSPTGAVIKDIINTTAQRYPVDILLSPAIVQGADAPKSIVHAIELLNRMNVDAIIVGRGGGSADDLSAFNDESVVRAVRGSKSPVISAVGHATDKTLIDLAADIYAENPTYAAMIATPDRTEELRHMRLLVQRLNSALIQSYERVYARFDSLNSRLSLKSAKDTIDVYSGRLGRYSSEMDRAMERMISDYRTRFTFCDSRLDPKRLMERLQSYQFTFDRLSDRMDSFSRHMIETRRNSLEQLSVRLDALDPNKVLERGYSFITDPKGDVIKSTSELIPGLDIKVRMKDGTVLAKVKEVRNND